MQLMLLQVLKENAAGAMDDALRHAGGAARIENIERVIERLPGECRRCSRISGEEILPLNRARNGSLRNIDIRDDDDALDRRDARRDLGNLVENGQRLRVVVIAVRGDQQLWSDLSETVDDSLRAEIGRARRPEGSEARSGQHPDDRLRHVGHHRADPVSDADAGIGECLLRA